MTNNELITKCIPKIQYLADKYANECHSKDELMSDGYLYLLEYLAKFDNDDLPTYTNTYNRLNYQIKLASTKPLDEHIRLTEKNVYIELTVSTDTFLKDMQSILSEKNYNMMTSYYGIYTDRKTYKQIADEYGLCVERVRQRINESIRKIRRYYQDECKTT